MGIGEWTGEVDMKQYIPSWMDLPELGSVLELVNREGELKALEVVYGHLPKERSVLIKEIMIDKDGRVSRYGRK